MGQEKVCDLMKPFHDDLVKRVDRATGGLLDHSEIQGLDRAARLADAVLSVVLGFPE